MLAAAAGCVPKVASTGQKIADPSQPLQTALARLKQDNYAGIQNNSITISSGTECFYSKAGKDAKGVSDQAVCGPIRRLGLSQAQVWDRYQLTFRSNSDGQADVTVGKHTAQGVAVDTSLLVSPTGDKPASAADVTAPQAPPTSIVNRAVAVADNATPHGLTFTPPSQPIKLITPAATISVTGIAQPAHVREALVTGQQDPAGRAAYYLPALGQKLYAYQVKISRSPNASLPVSTSGSTSGTDLTTALKLTAGGKDVPISDQTGSSGASPTLSVPCAATGSAAYPCTPRTTKITILATVPSNGSVALAASAAGGNQSVDLGTAAVKADVSTVEYGRSALTSKINKQLRTDPYQTDVQLPAEPTSQTTTDPKSTDPNSTDPNSTDPKSTAPASSAPQSSDPKAPQDQQPSKPRTVAAQASWSMKINSIGLTGYDPTLGWAPSGQAWLIVSTSKYEHSEEGATFTTDRAASLSLTAGSTTNPVKGPTDADLAGDPSSVNWAFAVPADATTATLEFKPTGTVTADGVTSAFTSDQTASLQLPIPH